MRKFRLRLIRHQPTGKYMKTVLVLAAGMSLAIALASAQPSPSSQAGTGNNPSATPSATAKASATISNADANESTGTIVEFIQGQSLVLNTGGSEPSRFKLAKNVTYSNPRGKTVGPGKLKKDRRVRVHYAKQGNDMVVDQVTLVREKKRADH
jgi:hypothetical protein